MKLPASANSTDGPYQGMILINPGGPGTSGIGMARDGAATIQSAVGSNFDIVGFELRGLGLSEPSINCSSVTTSKNVEKRDSTPRLTNVFYNSFIDYGKDLGVRCQEVNGGERDAGPHMTTATNARDLVSISDAFAKTGDGKRAAKDPKLVNYYGLSYGTFLGQTFASMFPDRVGNMAIDGVVSPEAYLAGQTRNNINHLDDIFAAFFVYCHEAGPEKCAYNTGCPAKDMFRRFKKSFVQLDAEKAHDKGWSNATDIENALLTLKVGMLGVGQQPLLVFPQLSQVLLGLEQALAAGALKSWTEQTQKLSSDPTPAGSVNPEWNAGVLCSDQDGSLFGKSLAQLQPMIKGLEKQSIFGEMWIKNPLFCVGWPIRSKDVFKGPFGGKTKTPILFVSNTYDPVTPIENSAANAPKFKGAQVLKVDGMGHTVSNTKNVCAFGKMRAYFQSSKLPGKDNMCPLEAGPFGVQLNGTLAKNIRKAGLSRPLFRANVRGSR
jgi:pimeloyl-ACP methyl ester carboxylesterase